jgi:hypothetical protein
VLLFWLAMARSQLCQRLEIDDWTSLVEAIEHSYDEVTFCGFSISGDACPPLDSGGYHVYSRNLMIACDSSFFENDCIIDCPSRHFTVHRRASLTLDGLTLVNSRRTSVNVLEGATLLSYNMEFYR